MSIRVGALPLPAIRLLDALGMMRPHMQLTARRAAMLAHGILHLILLIRTARRSEVVHCSSVILRRLRQLPCPCPLHRHIQDATGAVSQTVRFDETATPLCCRRVRTATLLIKRVISAEV